MNMKAFANGWMLRVAVAMAVAFAGLLFQQGVVFADHIEYDLLCGDGMVTEGDDLRVRVHEEVGEQFRRPEIWWYTEVGTADESDYTPLHGKKQVFSEEQDYHDRLYRNIHTTEDIYPELDETFNLRIGNQHNISNRTSCTVTIVNDDGGGVYKSEITSTPADGETYRSGEIIEVTMTPTHPVSLPNNIVAVILRVGEGDDNSRFATFVGDVTVFHSTMVFQYEVQLTDMDTDGVSVDEGDEESGFPDALGLNSEVQVIMGGDYHPINKVYRGIAESWSHRVDGRPYVKDRRIVSTPEDGIAYRVGESIDIDMTFDQDVQFSGSPSPSLYLHLDGPSWRPSAGFTETAFYDPDASTASRYRFSHIVREREQDNNGISIRGGWAGSEAYAVANPLVRAYRSFGRQDNIPGHNVDGGGGRPSITSLTVTSSPRVGDTYGEGEFIKITMEIDQPVALLSSAHIGLEVGTEPKSGIYWPRDPGTDSDSLVFAYRVYTNHVDNDGITIKANGLWGDIVLAADQSLPLNSDYPAQRNLSDHKVDGSLTTRPTIESLTFVSDPGPDGFYGRGDVIQLRLDFTERVTSWHSGEEEWRRSVVKMHLDGKVRDAKYDRDEDGAIFFTYTVTEHDRDKDGIAFYGQWLDDGYESEVLAEDGTVADTSGDTAIWANSDHKVDGRVGVTGVGVVSSPVHQAGYRAGETIELEVTFETKVTATSAAGLKLSIGNKTVTALYSGEADAPASETIRFAYVAQPGDIDDNGLTIPAMAYDGLGSGAVATSNGANVKHSFAAQEDLAGQLVDGDAHAKSVEVVSSPTSDDTYLEGEVIRVRVPFDQELGVEGEVSISLQVGDQVRAAWFDSSGDRITDSPEFTYTVQADDYDGGGIEVLDGFGGDGFIFGQVTLSVLGSIRPVVFVNPTPGAFPGHRVGERPYATSVEITAGPSDGATYIAGENIEVTMAFSQEVDAQNNPGIRLLVGPNGSQWVESLRVARYKSGSGTNSIVFSYQVQESDSDADGVTLDIDQAETGWGLHDFRGGKIYASGTTTPVSDRFPVEMYSVTSYNVEGSSVSPAPVADETAPTISSIVITSDPGNDYTYGAGDIIRVTVTFSEDVIVTGTPQLELEFYDPGSANQQASFESVNGAEVVFVYTVEASDSASDGLSIQSNKLTLNGGAIQDSAGNDAALTHSAYGPDADHLVSTHGGL